MKGWLFKLVLLIILLPSCEEKTNWEIVQGDLKMVVVDAILTNEVKQQTLKLSKPFGNINGESIPVSGAVVTVSNGTAEMNFAELPENPGTYLGEEPSGASIDKTYTLTVQTGGKVYSASTGMVPVIASMPLQVIAADNNLRKVNWTAPGYNPDDLAMYEVRISWSHLVDSTLTDTLTEARMMHYTLNTIDVSHIVFPQEKEEVLFPAGSILIVRKYSLTEDFAAYLRALLAETEWQGSLFEDARGNLPTNISNGGLGYFSACSVVADTVVAE
jgi:hypothetical protein